MINATRLQRLLAIALLGALLLGACAPAASPLRVTDVRGTDVLVVSEKSVTETAAAVWTAPPEPSQPAATLQAPPSQPAPTEPAIQINSLSDLRALVRDIASAAPAAAQVRADALYQTLASSQRVPLILGDQAVFFYLGEAQRVEWRGAWNGWSTPGVEGSRIGSTDLWTAQLALPLASRVEYKIVLNDKDWLVDPANANTQLSGLTGDNNVIVMPGFTVSDESQPRPGVPAGTLTGDLSINSRFLGYAVNYWVYTPAGYETLDHLPVLYVLDGNDFVEPRMGAMPAVLDNLIADGTIPPVLAVFPDAREPGNPANNRREAEFLVHPAEHARFIAEELAPAIDRAYRTDPRPDARVIVGVSYGGLSAVYIAATQSQVFHNLAAFSPALWALNVPQYLADDAQRAGAQVMKQALDAVPACGAATGRACPPLPLRLFLTAGVPAWDVGDLTGWVASLTAESFPVQFDQVREGHTWSQWRGQTDEMLSYFFGTPAGAD